MQKGQFSSLTDIEQHAISVAEQLAIDAHGVTEAQVAVLNRELGAAATVSLLTAASMHDAAIRMRRVLQQNTKSGAN